MGCRSRLGNPISSMHATSGCVDQRGGKKNKGKENNWSPHEFDSQSFNRESTLRFWVSAQLDNITAVHYRVGIANLIKTSCSKFCPQTREKPRRKKEEKCITTL